MGDFSLKRNDLGLSRQNFDLPSQSSRTQHLLYIIYTSTEFVAYVFGLNVVAHSSRCVQRPTGGIFICHRRRIESNFTREIFRQCIGQILRHGKYERTDFEELALSIGLHPVDQTDAGKL